MRLVKGWSKYVKNVRSPVLIKTSAGMPGCKVRAPNCCVPLGVTSTRAK